MFTNKSNEENFINLNNGSVVLESLESQEKGFQEQFSTMVQDNTFGGVDITDSNIKNNSRFIIDLGDVKKASEKELIDNAILESKEKLDRDKLIEIMELPGNIRSLPKKEQNEIILKTIIKTNEVLKNIQCDNSEYELSSRQKVTKNNTLNNIKTGEFLEAYYEITDFINNYGDNHNGKVFKTEKQEIYNLIMILYNKIKE